MFLRPAGLGGKIIGRGTGVVFSLLKRVTGVDLLEDLSVFFRSLGGLIDGFTERAERVGALLEDPATTFLIVTSPQHDPVEEAIFFHRKLREAGMPFGGMVVNRVHAAPETNGEVPAELVDELGDGAGRARRRRRRTSWRRSPRATTRRSTTSRRSCDAPPTIVIPELEDDVHDIDGLAQVRAHLFADGLEGGRLAPAARRSARMPSASVRSAGSRWPQRTSRRIARRLRAELLDERPRPPARRARGRRSRRARARPCRAARRAERVAVLGRGADRGQPLARRRSRARRRRRAARAPTSSQSESASHGDERSQPSSKRRSAHASSPARGVRRAISAQNARSGSSSSGASRQSPSMRRRPVASGTDIHGPPSVRAQAIGASDGSASSHSRSAVCSRRSRRPALLERRRLARRALEAQDGDGRVVVAVQVGRACRAASPPRTSARPSPSATSSASITSPSTGASTTDSEQPS